MKLAITIVILLLYAAYVLYDRMQEVVHKDYWWHD